MADFSLEKLGGKTYYIPGPVNIGLYVDEGNVYLIDSGNDKDAGRKVGKIIRERGWNLEMIINTHSNADHIGGNQFLQRSFSCRIGASQKEIPFIEYPEFEPMFLWGGYPHRKIEHKFLQAQPSHVTDVLAAGQTLEDSRLGIVGLPGHFIDMIGINTPDGILFAADALFSEHIINKYHIFYLFDVEQFLNTLNYLDQCNGRIIVPSHALPVESGEALHALIEINRNKIAEICQVIENICKEPKSPDEIIADTCSWYHLEISSAQYVLIGSTVRSYLGYLEKKERIRTIPEAYMMKWHTI